MHPADQDILHIDTSFQAKGTQVHNLWNMVYLLGGCLVAVRACTLLIRTSWPHCSRVELFRSAACEHREQSQLLEVRKQTAQGSNLHDRFNWYPQLTCAQAKDKLIIPSEVQQVG